MVSPHLENPADFPMPVFIKKGLCRDTPQLIYINVVQHMKKHSAKYIICCLIGLIQIQASAQAYKMENKISEIFFGLNLNQSPENIVKESKFDFQYSVTNSIGGNHHNYSTKINELPILDTEIKESDFRLSYDEMELEYGTFEVILVLRFENEYDQIDEYEKLVAKYEDLSSKTLIETTQNEVYETKSQVVVYQFDKKIEIPKISFYFDQSNEEEFPLVISFSTSWKMNKIKERLEKQQK